MLKGGAVIGAGERVRRDVRAQTAVCGGPAVVVRHARTEGSRQFGPPLVARRLCRPAPHLCARQARTPSHSWSASTSARNTGSASARVLDGDASSGGTAIAPSVCRTAPGVSIDGDDEHDRPSAAGTAGLAYLSLDGGRGDRAPSLQRGQRTGGCAACTSWDYSHRKVRPTLAHSLTSATPRTRLRNVQREQKLERVLEDGREGATHAVVQLVARRHALRQEIHLDHCQGTNDGSVPRATSDTPHGRRKQPRRWTRTKARGAVRGVGTLAHQAGALVRVLGQVQHQPAYAWPLPPSRIAQGQRRLPPLPTLHGAPAYQTAEGRRRRRRPGGGGGRRRRGGPVARGRAPSSAR